jgi:hypothetical protein
MSRAVQARDVYSYDFPGGRGLILDPDAKGKIRLEETDVNVVVGWQTPLSVAQIASRANEFAGSQIELPIIRYLGRMHAIRRLTMLRLVRFLHPEPSFLRIDGRRLSLVAESEGSTFRVACALPRPLPRNELATLLDRTADSGTKDRVWGLINYAEQPI